MSLRRHEVENGSDRLFSQALCRTANRTTKMRTDEELGLVRGGTGRREKLKETKNRRTRVLGCTPPSL